MLTYGHEREGRCDHTKLRILKQILRQHGFQPHRPGKGDHEIWTNGIISFPVDGNDGHEIPIGTLKAILKQAGITLEPSKKKKKGA